MPLKGASQNIAVIMDLYIAATEPIKDYLTRFSGLMPGDLEPATSTHALVDLKVSNACTHTCKGTLADNMLLVCRLRTCNFAVWWNEGASLSAMASAKTFASSTCMCLIVRCVCARCCAACKRLRYTAVT